MISQITHKAKKSANKSRRSRDIMILVSPMRSFLLLSRYVALLSVLCSICHGSIPARPYGVHRNGWRHNDQVNFHLSTSVVEKSNAMQMRCITWKTFVSFLMVVSSMLSTILLTLVISKKYLPYHSANS